MCRVRTSRINRAAGIVAEFSIGVKNDPYINEKDDYPGVAVPVP